MPFLSRSELVIVKMEALLKYCEEYNQITKIEIKIP